MLFLNWNENLKYVTERHFLQNVVVQSSYWTNNLKNVTNEFSYSKWLISRQSCLFFHLPTGVLCNQQQRLSHTDQENRRLPTDWWATEASRSPMFVTCQRRLHLFTVEIYSRSVNYILWQLVMNVTYNMSCSETKSE